MPELCKNGPSYPQSPNPRGLEFTARKINDKQTSKKCHHSSCFSFDTKTEKNKGFWVNARSQFSSVWPIFFIMDSESSNETAWLINELGTNQVELVGDWHENPSSSLEGRAI